MWFVACFSSIVVRCSLFVVCCWLFVIYFNLRIVCCLLRVACCMLLLDYVRVARSAFVVVRWLTLVAYCMFVDVGCPAAVACLVRIAC